MDQRDLVLGHSGSGSNAEPLRLHRAGLRPAFVDPTPAAGNRVDNLYYSTTPALLGGRKNRLHARRSRYALAVDRLPSIFWAMEGKCLDKVTACPPYQTDRGHGQHGVDYIQDSTKPRQQMAGIFKLAVAFQDRLGEVTG